MLFFLLFTIIDSFIARRIYILMKVEHVPSSLIFNSYVKLSICKDLCDSVTKWPCNFVKRTLGFARFGLVTKVDPKKNQQQEKDAKKNKWNTLLLMKNRLRLGRRENFRKNLLLFSCVWLRRLMTTMCLSTIDFQSVVQSSQSVNGPVWELNNPVICSKFCEIASEILNRWLNGRGTTEI